jgi:hypothetical protein
MEHAVRSGRLWASVPVTLLISQPTKVGLYAEKETFVFHASVLGRCGLRARGTFSGMGVQTVSNYKLSL